MRFTTIIFLVCCSCTTQRFVDVDLVTDESVLVNISKIIYVEPIDDEVHLSFYKNKSLRITSPSFQFWQQLPFFEPFPVSGRIILVNMQQVAFVRPRLGCLIIDDLSWRWTVEPADFESPRRPRTPTQKGNQVAMR